MTARSAAASTTAAETDNALKASVTAMLVSVRKIARLENACLIAAGTENALMDSANVKKALLGIIAVRESVRLTVRIVVCVKTGSVFV